MSTAFEEPTIPSIPPRLQRPLMAMWISLGLHAALVALVHVAPPAPVALDEPVIEVRLVSAQAMSPVVPAPSSEAVADTPDVPSPERPLLAPSEPVDTPPIAPQAPPLPVPAPPPVTPAAASPPLPAVTPSAKSQPVPVPVVALAPAAVPPPVATMTSSVDLTFYSAREVDVHPRALHEVKPSYPTNADRQHLSGKLVLQLKLQADGRVSDIEVLTASPPGVFEESALEAFRNARFSPAQKNGRPVRALVQIEVVYDWAGQMRR